MQLLSWACTAQHAAALLPVLIATNSCCMEHARQGLLHHCGAHCSNSTCLVGPARRDFSSHWSCTLVSCSFCCVRIDRKGLNCRRILRKIASK